MGDGVVEQIVIRATAGAEATLPQRASADAGRGLRGDRYFNGEGTYFKDGKDGQDLTLIDAEVLELVGLSGAQAGRNLVTRGIDLGALIGRHFRIGAVECFGARDCPPCALLQRRTRPGVLRALADCGGLRADVLVGGEIVVGDVITATGA